MQESNSYKVIELDPLINNNNPGVIRKDIKNKDGGNYYILRYDKDNMVDDIKKYRSVIFDNNNKLVCYSLPKSIPFNEFVENNNDINDDNVVITEIIEGTMINLFYDSEIDKWQLSSKGSVGCDYFFYRNGYDKKMKKTIKRHLNKCF